MLPRKDLRAAEHFLERAVPGCAALVRPIACLQGRLFPAEEKHICGSASKRQREFIATRTAAREAMRKLGLPPQPVLKGQGGEPLWPAGIVGSLSHTDRVCGCILAPRKRYLSLGLDLEDPRRMEERLFPRILTPEERDTLSILPRPRSLLLATAIFSAKEACIKCFYPVLGTSLRLKEMRVRFTRENKFEIMGAKGWRLEGVYLLYGDLVITALALPPRGK